MTKRTARNRRHGTNEMNGDAVTARKKGRISPTIAAENIEYTMIDLVRSVERLHFCKSGERKDTVLWADVKKYYKKHTGRVLSTEAFNKLAGVNGVSRKELIAGPLAGLLIAEDPAALVIRFKYDANKGDPLINHRFFLEASGAKTSVHHASDASPRLTDVTNTVSPSRSETGSAASSLSPTCLSSISTDPDTEAFSPLSAASPSSQPLSPNTCEYVTACDGGADADASFLTARTGRTTPMTSDWSSSSSRADSESPQNRSVDQDKTFNLLDVSVGSAAAGADTTMGPSELLVEMETSLKEEQAVKKVEEEEERREIEEEIKKEEKKEEEQREEEGSDKENQSVEAAKPLVDQTPADVPSPAEDVVVEEKKEEVEEEVKKADDVIVEVAAAAAAVVEKMEEEKPAEPIPAVEQSTEEVKEVEEEKKEEEVEVKEEEEEKSHDLAGGDGPLPAVTDEELPPPVPSTLPPSFLDATSPVTASSSDETLLTVIERPTVPQVEEEEEQEEEQSVVVQHQPLLLVEDKTTVVMEEKKKEDEVEEVIVVEKEQEVAAVAAFEQPKEEVDEKKEEEAMVVAEIAAVVEETHVAEEKEEEQDEHRVEEVKEVTEVAQHPVDTTAAKEEEQVPRVDTVEEKSEAVPAEPAANLASEEELSLSSTTEEPTATTMVSAAAVAAVAPIQQQPSPSPALAQTTPAAAAAPVSHEPMTSDDVDMNDVLAGGPNRDVHTPSVTAPITLQPKPAAKDDDTEVITHQPVMVVDELDSAPALAAASSSKEDIVPAAASPDDLALRRAAPAKKFPCCTIV